MLHVARREIFQKKFKMLARLSRAGISVSKRINTQVRFSSGIKLLNERAKAEEDYYFSKQDGMMTFDPIYYAQHREAYQTYDSGQP